MNRLNVMEAFGNEIQLLYDNRPKDESLILDRGFSIEKTIGIQSILFIGMNPSFNEEKDKRNGTLGIVSYYDDYSYRYFSQMVKIASACGVGIAHHDLYFVKELSQNKVIDLSSKHYKYFQRQIEITNCIIDKAQPLAIVIANAAVSELFIDRQNNRFRFDDRLGSYVLSVSNLNSVPVFCSSMLTGTRALDVYSRERLVWQIQKALNLPIKDTMLKECVDWRNLMY